MEKRSIIARLYYFMIICFAIITLLGIVKSIFISLDMDEGYAIAQSYRLIKGDKLILNMWEPHQLSAYLSAFFMNPFIMITQSTTGIVIYLRVVGNIIHIIMGLLLFYVVKKETNSRMGIICFFLHMNYLAKWLVVPEFELISYWLMLVSVFVLWKFINTKNTIWLLVLGIVVFLQMLNYPTMIILYPIYLFFVGRVYGLSFKKVLLITLGAAIPGLAFLIYLFSYMSISDFAKGLSHIMSDPSHTEVSFFKRMLSFGNEFIFDLFLIGGGFIISYLICLWVRNLKSHIVIAFLVELSGFEVAHIIGCLFFDQNQFFLQERYFLLFVFCVALLYLRRKEKNRDILYFVTLSTLTGVIAAMLLSNMTLSVAYSKFFLCGVVVLMEISTMSQNGQLFIGQTTDSRTKEQGYMKTMTLIPFILIIIGMMVCKLILIRVTGCLPVTLRASMKPITNGPAKGIYMLADQAEIINNNYLLMTENIGEEDKLFYFGCENLSYLNTEATICTASVQGTSVFNQDFIDYFEMFPDKSPNVIAFDKSFELIEAYRYSPWNYVVKDWILNGEYEEIIEGDYMVIYRKKIK